MLLSLSASGPFTINYFQKPILPFPVTRSSLCSKIVQWAVDSWQLQRWRGRILTTCTCTHDPPVYLSVCPSRIPVSFHLIYLFSVVNPSYYISVSFLLYFVVQSYRYQVFTSWCLFYFLSLSFYSFSLAGFSLCCHPTVVYSSIIYSSVVCPLMWIFPWPAFCCQSSLIFCFANYLLLSIFPSFTFQLSSAALLFAVCVFYCLYFYCPYFRVYLCIINFFLLSKSILSFVLHVLARV